jgi:mRNA-degrading endonuclease toxin of MazEF toxin-antitoxin module
MYHENPVYRMDVINDTIHECAPCPIKTEARGYAFTCKLPGLTG